jgi:hypothetical protein
MARDLDPFDAEARTSLAVSTVVGETYLPIKGDTIARTCLFPSFREEGLRPYIYDNASPVSKYVQRVSRLVCVKRCRSERGVRSRRRILEECTSKLSVKHVASYPLSGNSLYVSFV